MNTLNYVAMPRDHAKLLQIGGLDFFQMVPETHLSDGEGIPCRHCLENVPKGKHFLILSYRPFEIAQPYAEVGPVFLCANPCRRFEEQNSQPEMFASHGPFLIKAYDINDRICYGYGTIVNHNEIQSTASRLLENSAISYLHLRSARNNCYWCRIERIWPSA